MNNLVNKKAFYVSNILDNTNENKVATYKLVTDFADDYHFSCKESSSITLYDDNEKIINLYSLGEIDYETAVFAIKRNFM